ncbi:ABC transporter ATP-binding protein [Fibrobacter sp. UWEL]|uniref:ABC transporter ATP-binding protein n=1 Tax=Fibrobacter sp. UWEL TaxID=1896209 RepID=UPI00091936FA|nr:ABC transporter ATP-binding protein [Fibrobacter sp. UWEL]SHK34675.1 peptide/nickel transport system ATP-binding protein [Fibrobacter sp. UWEL]
MSKVLSVKNLSVAFGFSKGKKGAFVCKEGTPLQVTDRVSFDIHKGEFFALVGESGCGKSVTAMSILRLLPQPSAQIVDGEVLFNADVIPSESSHVIPSESSHVIPSEAEGSVDLAKLPLTELQRIRGSEIACIFQEPMQALNPVLSIKKQLLEVCKSLDTIREQLKSAGFTDSERVLDSYPHELSGGMLQRVCIVMALLANPKLIIADEPTTALDVTVQAQVLAVLKEMASRSGTAVLLITHNMGIVSQYADRVAVMYAGRIVEMGGVDDVINDPLHPYTRGLLAAIPESHSQMKNLKSIPGSVPHPRDFVSGCRFADRCERCMQGSPELQAKCRSTELPPKAEKDGHCAFCFNP